MSITRNPRTSAVLITLALVVSCTGTNEREATKPSGSAAEPGVAHVHGLAIDPTNDDLLIATHTGLYRLAEAGQPIRIGPSYQDTMAFTVVSPDLYLGSGHPDVAGLREGQPGLLGLVQSTDQGRSWTSLSLSGTADLHSLVFSEGQLFGWDSVSSRFMVTTDMKSWETRSTLELAGFAVDPSSPDRIVAAVGRGVARSQDGGHSWSDPDGPGLTTISWAANGELWGADQTGTVYSSSESGTTWTAIGNVPGAPQAMFAGGNALWLAVERPDGATAIYRTYDGGVSWQRRFEDRN